MSSSEIDAEKQDPSTEGQNVNGSAPCGEGPTEHEKKIITQIEYYFGDENMRRDRFLKEEVTKEPEGWVSLEILIKFNRLKQLTTDFNVICTALDKATKKLVQVKESRDAVRRNPDLAIQELNKDLMQDRRLRTVYVKGFPIDDCNIDQLLEYFHAYGPTVVVNKRFAGERGARTFKGSVFAQYERMRMTVRGTRMGRRRGVTVGVMVKVKWRRQAAKKM